MEIASIAMLHLRVLHENLEIVYHQCDYSVLNPHFDGGLYMKLRDSCTTR